jgi:glycosyltransferase involved in cell wall biosynthesis
MRQNLKFSVLISVYKKDNPIYFKEALDSVLNQTLAPNEIVIVIDGYVSQDIQNVIQEYVSRHNIIKTLQLQENMGLAIALNKGLEICSYDIVARMDSDDICLLDRFEKQIACFQNDENLDVLGGYIQEIDSVSKRLLGVREVPLDMLGIKKFIRKRSSFNHVSVMFRKKAVLAVDGYRDLTSCEDYDLWIRMTAKNFKMQNLSDVLVYVRVNEGMYKRRGGLNCFKSNVILQNLMLRFNMNSPIDYGINIPVRFVVHVLMPNAVRGLFYNNILRVFKSSH